MSSARLPIRMLHDRVLVSTADEAGERRTGGGIVIPATAAVGKRLAWGAVVAAGQHVRQVQVGDLAVAIGAPLGLSNTVTDGIVSATNRAVATGSDSEQAVIDAIQTDAPINPGNSGGPLVNLRGQVVGVNSAIATNGGATNDDAGNIGVGFAIPVEQVRITADQILKTGQARYPVIGATVGGAEVGAEDGRTRERRRRDAASGVDDVRAPLVGRRGRDGDCAR